jgi:hypothetical protein
MVSGENDDDGDDDDALSRYDAVTCLADLPDVRPFLEPIGGSTSQASRAASTPVEGEEELGEKEARAGPSTGGLPRLGPRKKGQWRYPHKSKHLGLRW